MKSNALYCDLDLLNKFPWLVDYRTHLKVDILYDTLDSNSAPDQEIFAGQETEDVANEIALALQTVGHLVKLWPITDFNFKSVIDRLSGDIVFNQVEADKLGFKVLQYLEAKQLKVTGVDSLGYELSWDKVKIKKILINAHIPTPGYTLAKRNQKLNFSGQRTYPQIVKSANDHGSLSINQKSVVSNVTELNLQVDWIHEVLKDDALIEDYIQGRELSLSFIGNSPELILLPVKEILFGPVFAGRANIVTYDSKWVENSVDYQNTLKFACPANLDNTEIHNLHQVIMSCIKFLKPRDYGRFDIRLWDKIPYLIDYNANPAIGYDAASRIPAEVFGLTYPAFINAIVISAMHRYG